MTPALIALAVQAGLPWLKKILTGEIGATDSSLVASTLAAIAKAAGVGTDALEDLAASDPDKLTAAMNQVEQTAPEMIALYAKGLDYQIAQLAAEKDEPMWMRAWRPIGVYVLLFLWLWEIVLHHVFNAYWKIALPNCDEQVLMGLTTVYFTLLMGGHTIKDFVSKKWGSSS